MKSFRMFLLIVCVSLLILFIVANAQPVQLRFLFFESAAFPLFVVILGAFLLGFVVAWCWALLTRPRPRPAAAGTSHTTSPRES